MLVTNKFFQFTSPKHQSGKIKTSPKLKSVQSCSQQADGVYFEMEF